MTAATQFSKCTEVLEVIEDAVPNLLQISYSNQPSNNSAHEIQHEQGNTEFYSRQHYVSHLQWVFTRPTYKQDNELPSYSEVCGFFLGANLQKFPIGIAYLEDDHSRENSSNVSSFRKSSAQMELLLYLPVKPNCEIEKSRCKLNSYPHL